MAILINCWKCKTEFMTSACHGSSLCDDCNGNNEARRQERARWDALTNEQKIEELLGRVQSLEAREWNPLIG